MEKGQGREKSRTPKEDRKKSEDMPQKEVKATAKKSDSEEQDPERRRLEFSREAELTQTANASKQAETTQEPQQTSAAAPRRARFSESEEESSEAPKSVLSDKSKITQASTKTETPTMALTTQRLEEMTVSTPVRGDGTKTPLKMPPTQVQKHRSTSSHSRSSSEEQTEREEEPMEVEDEISVENIQQKGNETDEEAEQRRSRCNRQEDT